MSESVQTPKTHKDYASDQEVRWCPGCGDNSILIALRKAMAEMQLKTENLVFVSGIGCAARFPYYMNSYGFHTIHGRGTAIATGLKLANPELSVWVATGDGDSLAIGGNHFIHLLRRNVDVNVILFNNEIYGLTKGQFSPTSVLGQKTKSSPQGTIDKPFSPGTLALGAEATFFARTADTLPKQMTEIFVEAEKHRGTSLVEILQNCIIFNDKCFDEVTGKDGKDDNQLWLQHGQPMIFGSENNKGLVLQGLGLKVVTIGENGVSQDDILVHDAENPSPILHQLLATMRPPEYPMALGVIRRVEATTYDQMVADQIHVGNNGDGYKKVDELLFSGETWKI